MHDGVAVRRHFGFHRPAKVAAGPHRGRAQLVVGRVFQGGNQERHEGSQVPVVGCWLVIVGVMVVGVVVGDGCWGLVMVGVMVVGVVVGDCWCDGCWGFIVVVGGCLKLFEVVGC